MIYRKKRFNLRTYEPKKRLEIDGERVATGAFGFGAWISSLSGGLLILTGWIFYPIIAFLGLREKFREFRMNHERVVDFRRTRFRRFGRAQA